MRIDVHDTGKHFDDQTRAYAEYRVFSTLATRADIVHKVGVGLVRAADAAETSTSRDVFACSVSIRLRSGRQMDVASHAHHPYEAIDSVARRIAAVVNSHADASKHQRLAVNNSHNDEWTRGKCDMNMYRILGDYVGTSEARVLAEQLVTWHDSMVKHLRVVGSRREAACADDCPHDEAALLWSAAQTTFGARAEDLAFLRSHGQRRRRVGVHIADDRVEMHA